MIESTLDQIDALLGIGEQQLSVAEVTLRAITTLVVTLVIMRLGSTRLIGKGTAFDFILAVIIGSTMSRAINGSAPLYATWVAVAALVAVHWIIAWFSSRVSWFGPLVKGSSVPIIRDGAVLRDGMHTAKLSDRDLEQAFRSQGQQPDPASIAEARMEPDGSVSMIPRQGEPQVVEVSVADGVQTVRISMG